MTCAALLQLLPLAGTVFAMDSGDTGFRLPTNLAPTHYWLKLLPSFEDQNFHTSGEVRIALRCDRATNEVVFNQNSINITLIKLTNESGHAIQTREQETIEKRQMYRIKLDSLLEKGKNYYLDVIFSYTLNDQLEGFYKSSYVNEAGNKRWLATTQFSPINARRAFPCWDEPSFKAKFSISIGRAKSMTSLSNMERINTTALSGKEDWFWDHYQDTVPMSTYLIAFIVCDFPYMDIANTTSPHFKVWSRNEVLPEMSYLATISPKILNHLADYFQIPFPLNKIDLFAVPDFGFSAMENWGLITFAESAIKNSLTIAHELTHMWFGNLVTPHWWEDLWLKEGFATFLGIKALSHIDNSTEAIDQWIVDQLHHSMFEDSLLASHPVSNPVVDPASIWQAFDVISYEKGSAIIRMMCGFLGEDIFRQGLILYLQRYSYGNAKREEFWQSYDNISNIVVGDVMDNWTLQVGYPVLNVKRDYSNGSIVISQKRFLLNNENEDIKSFWNVPVSYKTKKESSENNHVLWLNEKEKHFQIDNLTKDDWILVNLDQTGYYRVNYDSRNWEMLLETFQTLPRLSKMQLINDGFNLAMADQLTYDVPMLLIEKINDVNDVLIWNVTTIELKSIVYLLNKTPLLNSFKDYIVSILPLENINYLDTVNISLVNFATFLDDKHMVSRALEVINEIMGKNDTLKSIPKQLRPSIYCTAVKHSKQEVWNFIWSRFVSEIEPEEKRTLLQSLCCSKDQSILQKMLNKLLMDDSGIRKQDARFLFQAIAHNAIGADLALNFLSEKWNEIGDRYGMGYKIVSSMVLSLGKLLNQEYQYKILHELYMKNIQNLGSTSNAFRNSLERIRINIIWQENNYKQIENWIKMKKQK